MPVHREAGGRKESVYAWSDEIDKWRVGNPCHWELDAVPDSNSKSARNEPPKIHAYTKFLKFNRQSWLSLIVLSVLGGFLLLSVVLLSGGDPEEDNLFFHFHEYDRGSQVHIYNANNVKVKSFRSGMINFKESLLPDKNELRMLKTVDLNHDGWLDIVFADLQYSPTNTLYIYLRQDEDSVRLERSWSLSELYEYENERFGDFGCEQIICEDLNNDGKMEILVGMNSHPNYPSVCRVFDVNGAVIASIYHPGWFGNFEVFDRDENGLKEIYVAATNNFLDEEFSAPVMYVVESDWHGMNQELSFFGENRSLAASVATDFRVIYICFKADHVLPDVKDWECALLGPFTVNKPSPTPISVHASPHEIMKADGTTRLIYLRRYFFNRELDCIQSFVQQEYAVNYNINVDLKEVQDLLRPIFWNGADWQEEVCEMPQHEE